MPMRRASKVLSPGEPLPPEHRGGARGVHWPDLGAPDSWWTDSLAGDFGNPPWQGPTKPLEERKKIGRALLRRQPDNSLVHQLPQGLLGDGGQPAQFGCLRPAVAVAVSLGPASRAEGSCAEGAVRLSPGC